MSLYKTLKKSFVRNIVDIALKTLPNGSGGAFPGSPTAGLIFYRTDEDKLYRYTTVWTEIDIDYFFFDMDTHATEQSLPDHSYVAQRGFSLEVDEHLVRMDAFVGVSILNDVNLTQHDNVLDAIFDSFLPTAKLPVYHQTTGLKIGEFTVLNGTEVLPMAKADQRPLQFVGVALTTDLTVNLVPQ